MLCLTWDLRQPALLFSVAPLCFGEWSKPAVFLSVQETSNRSGILLLLEFLILM